LQVQGKISRRGERLQFKERLQAQGENSFDDIGFFVADKKRSGSNNNVFKERLQDFRECESAQVESARVRECSSSRRDFLYDIGFLV
jgi:hypothetical protein